MLIQRHHQSLREDARGAVVAIGNFDGIHRGHQAVLARAREMAERRGAPFGLLTFEPHPRRVFKPDLPPFRLTSLRTKARLLAAMGADVLYAQAFNRTFASLSADAFVETVLARHMGVKGVVVGPDFHYGKGRGGNPAHLEAAAERLGFAVEVLDPVTSDLGEPFSSTLVRQYLSEGKVTRAALLLGRYWEIGGKVLGGRRLGRTIGFPTANLKLRDMLRPAYGVYAVRVEIEGEDGVWHPGVANLGVRPTVEGADAEPLLEVHIFDRAPDLYGRHLRVAMVDFVRAERKFDGLDALKAQIARDCDAARETLAWETWDGPWPASPYLKGGPRP
ncbi:MAG: bifunctional riboflavin kinase/FAD synthetase [Alphaproteobacteria bacterium]|nr:bifunctional riboflavin kinase/FAD synthetase [Alphaproteobacteria bacterium]MDX5368701.1 bifunctional riboflavin kinase/FAD synthetase [Alphaproteobacteria bacterium]MDX5463443.1 bifunctional riboflavin kinase/FAD synthetase [Alphaproteobacteria bacterium]